MKVITWNVNSIRTRLERTKALLARHQPDLLCLQETKTTDDVFPAAEFEALGYRCAVHGQKTYNGVALLAREPLQDVACGFPGDPIPEQARVIGATLGGVRVLDLYVVNGSAPDSAKFAVKMAWLDALRTWIEREHDPAQALLLVGDFNVAPEDRDVHDPEKWRGKIHCSDAERAHFRGLLDWGLQDLLRLHDASADVHTWWDYRMGAFHRGWGLRIDLALGTAAVAARCTAVEIDRDERKATSGEGKPSDHAPVIVTLAD
ncbi:MAG TPA: exodeoxyribonuclease III [Planctomycetota bacterium]